MIWYKIVQRLDTASVYILKNYGIKFAALSPGYFIPNDQYYFLL
jgi:hypothetical protein